MSLRIGKIDIKDCGPIKSFTYDFSSLNFILIYGKNESGKSFLVEVIIDCLFRDKKNWGYLREKSGKGIIELVINGESRKFGLNKRNYLENVFSRDLKGLPISILNLFIVKSGEVEIVKNYSGIDKNFIRELFCSHKIINSIDEKISKTIKEAELMEGGFSIDKKGEGKKFEDLKKEYEKIEGLIERFMKEYEGGNLKEIELKKSNLEKEKEKMERAKRYKAFKLTCEIDEIENKLRSFPEMTLRNIEEEMKKYRELLSNFEYLRREIEKIERETSKMGEIEEKREKLLMAKRYRAFCIKKEIDEKKLQLEGYPEEKINDLELNIRSYKEKLVKINQMEKDYEMGKEKIENYEWLKSLRDIYQNFLLKGLQKKGILNYLPYIIFTTIIAGSFSFISGKNISGVFLMTFCFLSLIYYFLNIRREISNSKLIREMESLRDEFKRRFKRELNNFSDIEMSLNQMSEEYSRINSIREKIEDLKRELNLLREIIMKDIKELKGVEINDREFDSDILKVLKEERRKILNEIESLKMLYSKLNVKENELVSENPQIEYNEIEFEKIERELHRLKSYIEEREKKKKELEVIEAEIKRKKEEIEKKFKMILKEDVNEEEWENKINLLKKELEELRTIKREKEAMLAGLGVGESEFIKEDPKVDYSAEKLKEIENKIGELEERLKVAEKKNSNLKYEICRITGDDITTDLNKMIENLYKKRDEIFDEIRNLEAYIFAGKLVHETIEELRREEDGRIAEILNSEEIRDILLSLTKRYKSIGIEDEKIKIMDDFYEFPVEDLSTGAKEQVMLSLRIGFIKKILKENKGFLILDDAFQHSDYEKRPILIENLMKLALEGWQIIYLTMDENIKDLILRKKHTLGELFKLINLNN